MIRAYVGRPLKYCMRRFMSSTANESIGSSSSSCIEYSYHRPVLLDECCDYLNISTGGVYVDCTLGGGGHTREILRRGGSVIGCDQDLEAISTASSLLTEYLNAGTLEIAQINFRSLESYLKRSNMASAGTVDGILLDLGVSSHQINEGRRGFAFSASGPLDMRMAQTPGEASPGTTALTAANIVNEYPLEELANVLFEFGDETRSRQIAREIVASRPLNTTGELAAVINRITPWKHRTQTLARCFQALRIVVNDELGALHDLLESAHRYIDTTSQCSYDTFRTLIGFTM
jgi:16S rRNA (cytosine1402-N4)-methyltransferase